MLVLTVHLGEGVRIKTPTGELIIVKVMESEGGRGRRIGIDAPISFRVDRLDRRGELISPKTPPAKEAP